MVMNIAHLLLLAEPTLIEWICDYPKTHASLVLLTKKNRYEYSLLMSALPILTITTFV